MEPPGLKTRVTGANLLWHPGKDSTSLQGVWENSLEIRDDARGGGQTRLRVGVASKGVAVTRHVGGVIDGQVDPAGATRFLVRTSGGLTVTHKLDKQTRLKLSAGYVINTVSARWVPRRGKLDVEHLQEHEGCLIGSLEVQDELFAIGVSTQRSRRRNWPALDLVHGEEAGRGALTEVYVRGQLGPLMGRAGFDVSSGSYNFSTGLAF